MPYGLLSLRRKTHRGNIAGSSDGTYFSGYLLSPKKKKKTERRKHEKDAEALEGAASTSF
jgi:hypothetical protein